MTVEYSGLDKNVMHEYKLNCKRAGAKNLATVINDNYPYKIEPLVVTFVPTSGKHVRWRGFDHAKALAESSAGFRGWRIRPMLIKRKSTSQASANRETRKKQIQGAYQVSNRKMVKGASILLIDDVVTTGATIEACTKQLYYAGAKSVEVLAFARTPN